ncbi:MAG: FG-GAP-like repeat-containing protein [Verrucomicrobia bacterium]|nr:FG-GAP-like repeat-containing protein [Verrucomicrobiota bacterium]
MMRNVRAYTRIDRHRLATIAVVGVLCLVGLAPSADGVIRVLYTLESVMDQSTVIVEGEIVAVDVAKQTAVAKLTHSVKGETKFAQIKMNFAVGQEWYPEAIMTVLEEGKPILFFYADYPDQRFDLGCLAHVNGIWFQIFAAPGHEEKQWWTFTHLEPWMNRTYRGTTPEFIRLVREVIAGTREPPAPNPAEKPLTRDMFFDKKTVAEKSPDPVSIDPKSIEKSRNFVRALILPHDGGEARGVSWADFDGDGDLDVLVCSTHRNRLYRNESGELADVTAKVQLRGGSRCASWADYDGDGDLDLFLSTPALWTNDDGIFRDDSGQLPKLGAMNTEGAGWIDADGDGHPDLLLSNGASGIHLFLNTRKKTDRFINATADWSLGHDGPGVGNGDFLSMADFDGDGFTDFLYNYGNGVLVRNRDGEGFEQLTSAGLQFQALDAHKIGTAVGDFDNDGDMDIFVPQQGKSRLFRNNNDSTFTDVIAASGDLAQMSGNARTSAWGDFDNDGDQDLVVGFSDQRARLFMNSADGRFTDFSELSGISMFASTRNATGLAPADWDGDGDLDLLVNSDDAAAAILINQPPPAKTPHSTLQLRLPRGTAPGALVRVYDAADNIVASRLLGLVQNFSSQTPPHASFSVVPGRYGMVVLFTNGEVIEKQLDTTSSAQVTWDMRDRLDNQKNQRNDRVARQPILSAHAEEWAYAAASDVHDDAWKEAKYQPTDVWRTGKAPLGYGEAWIREKQGTLIDLKEQNLCLRHVFTVDKAALGESDKFNLLIASDDSAKVWINGIQVDSDDGNHEAKYWNRTVDLPAGRLHPGTNVIAVMLHNHLGSSDVVWDVQLESAARIRASP